MNSAYTLGQNGEQAAVLYLQQQGYTIRHLNWRHHHIELDIVAETPQHLVIIEVKTRSDVVFNRPWQAVNYAKIRHIVRAAHAYVLQHQVNKEVRFDIISVVSTSDGTNIEHLQDAFVPPVETR